MFSKLDEVESRYEQVNMSLQRPDIASDQKQYRALMKELAELEKVVVLYRDFKKKKSSLEANKELFTAESDSEMRELLREEIKDLEAELPGIEEKLKIALIPKDPNDDKNVLLEIRAGAGGDEASLFADELFRAYVKYASNQGWKVEMLSFSEGNVGGAKEVIASVSGDSVFSKLKFESRAHVDDHGGGDSGSGSHRSEAQYDRDPGGRHAGERSRRSVRQQDGVRGQAHSPSDRDPGSLSGGEIPDGEQRTGLPDCTRNSSLSKRKRPVKTPPISAWSRSEPETAPSGSGPTTFRKAASRTIESA